MAMQLTISQKKERVEEDNVIKEKVRKNTEMMLTQNETKMRRRRQRCCKKN